MKRYECKVPGCGRYRQWQGLCKSHDRLRSLRLPLSTPIRPYRKRPKPEAP